MPESKSQFYSVEYDGERNIQVPIRLCEPVEEVDYITYATPMLKRVCTTWDSDCPYQLSVKQNQRLSITMENDDYYFGEIVDEGPTSSQGWVQKSLVVYMCFFPNKSNIRPLYWSCCIQLQRYHLVGITNIYSSNSFLTLGMNRSLFTTLAFFFPLPDLGTSVQISFTFSRILFQSK